MAAGKNKLLRGVRLFFGGYNLSGDTRTFDRLDYSTSEVDTWGLSNANGTYLSDMVRMLGVLGYQALLNDVAAGAYTQLAAAPQNLLLSVLIGDAGAEPAIGNLAYLLAAVQLKAPVDFSSKIGLLHADFLPNSEQYNANALNPWGVVLHPETSLAANTNGTSVDNGASSANGGHANLHVVASSGGTWSLRVQHSPDDSTWADLILFSANGSTITSERGVVSGTIDRYTRARLLRTSGTVTPVITFARN